MTKEQIIWKFENMGLENNHPGIWSNASERFEVSIDNYSFDKNKPSLGILIINHSSMEFGSIYSYTQGIKKIQEIIQRGLE